MKKKELILAIAIILIGAATRFIPHLPNFVPVTAIALFGGRYFSKFFAFLIPLSIMVVSDCFLGFSDVTFYVYIGILAAALLGYHLKKRSSVGNLAVATLSASVIFFLLSNFGVWAAGWYGHTFQGLVSCFAMAIPFFRNSLLGDVFYSGVMFGAYELIRSKISTPAAVLES